jgi:hypothetical protein
MEGEEDVSLQSALKYKLGRIGYEACPGDGLLDCENIQPAFIPLIRFGGITMRGIFGLIGLCQFLPQFGERFFNWLGSPFKNDHLVSAFKVQRDMWILHDIASMSRLGTAVVVDFSVYKDGPARNDMRPPVGVNGAQPVIFGLGQLLGDITPRHFGCWAVHVTWGKGRASDFWSVHIKTIKQTSMLINGKSGLKSVFISVCKVNTRVAHWISRLYLVRIGSLVLPVPGNSLMIREGQWSVAGFRSDGEALIFVPAKWGVML